MKIEQSKNLPEVIVVTPDVFHDFRGKYVETYNEKEYSVLVGYDNKPLKFVQDDVSVSRQNVLRGLHGDFKTWKLVSCLYGDLYFVVIDNRKESENYLKYHSMILDDKKRKGYNDNIFR